MRWLERRPAAERECGPDGDAVEGYREVGAWKPVTMNVAGYRGASSNRFIDFLPVDLLSASRGTDHPRSANRKHVNSTHHFLLLHGLVARCRPRPRRLLICEQTCAPHVPKLVAHRHRSLMR